MNRKEVRMKNDYAEMLKLKAESSIVDFQTTGTPPYLYILIFRCAGLRIDEGGNPAELREHRCQIQLGSLYPSQPPDVTWLSPIFHPNIKLQAVCHSGQWAPSWSLAEFVSELADMVRYAKYNLQSVLDTKAAEWAKRNLHLFPLDPRPIRDKAGKINIKVKPHAQGIRQRQAGTADKKG